MKHNILHTLPFLGLLFISVLSQAQVNFDPIFNQFRLEARADFDFNKPSDNLADVLGNDLISPNSYDAKYGMHGRYFNLIAGGTFGEKFSYFFRQRVVANSGSVNLFDNTDFLYVNYMPTKNWTIRLGKDALAVGGFEYDAAPIDVLFSTYYWDNFYCFQPAAAAAYKTNDGHHMFMGQIGNSPYVFTNGGASWDDGLLAYSLYYAGDFGHYKMLSSVNWFQRPDRGFLNYIAIGQKLQYTKWDIYLDLIHHAMTSNDWGNNFAVVSCANWYVHPNLSFFIKGAYEQNFSESALGGYPTTGMFDILSEEEHSYCTYGLGMEYRPEICPSFRLHAYVANRTTTQALYSLGEEYHGDLVKNSLMVNCGISWNMDFNRMWKENAVKTLNALQQ